MIEKNYDFIVRLKLTGDFDTFFATKIEGTLADPFITIYTKNKEGIEKKTQISSDLVGQIEEIVKTA